MRACRHLSWLPCTQFEDVPEIFAFGMLCALIAGWAWVTLATYLELAVSTTHSISKYSVAELAELVLNQ